MILFEKDIEHDSGDPFEAKNSSETREGRAEGRPASHPSPLHYFIGQSRSKSKVSEESNRVSSEHKAQQQSRGDRQRESLSAVVAAATRVSLPLCCCVGVTANSQLCPQVGEISVLVIIGMAYPSHL